MKSRMLAGLALVIIAATVGYMVRGDGESPVVPDKQYVEKSIESAAGFTSLVWIATGGSFDLEKDRGVIQFSGWKDVASYKAGKAKSGTLTVAVTLSQLTTFSALWTELANKVVAEGAGKLAGGTVKNTADE